MRLKGQSVQLYTGVSIASLEQVDSKNSIPFYAFNVD